ncbi:hypothetical protein B0H14DRAFT_2514769 [Mycena olivaceomarginata]|nr:hypothetical protein B0H14DRAFT_2514769 [Mycena olivaceomarginata]
MADDPSAILFPHLPPELERVIFKLAALARPKKIPILILAARRVKEWVEPLLYRVVIVCSYSAAPAWGGCGFPIFTVDVLLRAIATKPAQFLQNSVQHLFLDAPLEPSALEAICEECNKVVNLFDCYTFATVSDLGVFGALSDLRFIALALGDFLRCCNVEGTRSLLANITHLELLDTMGNERMENLPVCLPLLPRLTHLALTSISFGVPLQIALRDNKNIQCILFLVSDSVVPQKPESPGVLAEDDRFVCMDQGAHWRQDWLRGADTGESYWTLADAFIVARRKGTVDRSRYRISTTDTSW